MSLKTIRDLRIDGHRPDGVVWVVVGKAPKWLDNETSVVKVSANDRPHAMDWRPLIGLWVAIFQTEPLPDLAWRVLGSLEQAGAKLFGMADGTGAYPAIQNPTQEHELCLRRTWELLCS